MVAEPVSLNPSLRPWHRAGVEFLLAAEAVPAPCSLCLAAPVAAGGRIGAGAVARTGSQQGVSSARPVSPAPSGIIGGRGQAPAGAPQAAQGAARAPYAGPHSGSSPASLPAPSSVQAQPAPPARQAAPQAYVHPDAWPAIWRQRLQKTAPAAVLWTYWALGEDMCVRPNPVRRALLQKMLADLGHPAGTHSFWPAALPQSPEPAAAAESETALYPAPEIFWSGVQHLKARALVVMGSPALKALELPARLRPFQQTRHNGTLIVVLRDVDFLAQETNRYDAVKAFLRQALAPFGR